MSLDAAYAQAMKVAGQPRGRIFIRFGRLPAGTSGIGDEYRQHVLARTGVHLPEKEKGISVFPAYRSKVLGRYVIPESHGWVGTLSEVWDTFTRGYSSRPAMLLTGRVVGEGSDGEPLLRRSTIVKRGRLSPMDIYADGQVNLWSDGENEVPLGMSMEERRRFSEAMRQEMRAARW